MQQGNSFKEGFRCFHVASLWREAGSDYPILSDTALKILIEFTVSYLCEAFV
jgi:hypothetical protein